MTVDGSIEWQCRPWLVGPAAELDDVDVAPVRVDGVV
jgi:hypothetical protein